MVLDEENYSDAARGE